MVNFIWPISHWDISMGISITYSTVVLVISMMIGTIVGLTVKSKQWIAVPDILPAIYWCEVIYICLTGRWHIWGLRCLPI